MWNYPQTTPSGVGVPPWARWGVAGTWGNLRVWEEEMQAPRGSGGVGRSRTRSAWAERPALFPAGPLSGPVCGWSDVRRGTLLPWPHSTAQAVGRKGVLACTVPGQAPVPGPERWKGGELRSHPRLPNPESEAFIRSVLTWIMSWPRKEEEIDEERAEAPELAAQSQLCQHLPAVGLPRPWPITTVSAPPQPWAFQGHDWSQLRVSSSPAVGLPRRWPITTVSAPPQPWAFQGDGRSQLRVSSSLAVGLPSWWPVSLLQRLPSFLGASLWVHQLQSKGQKSLL